MLDIRDDLSTGDTVSSLSAPGLIGKVCSIEGKLYDSLSAASAAKEVGKVY